MPRSSTSRTPPSTKHIVGYVAILFLGTFLGVLYERRAHEVERMRTPQPKPIQRLYEAASQILITLAPDNRVPEVENVKPPQVGKPNSLHNVGFRSHEYVAKSKLIIGGAVEKFRLHELSSFKNTQPQNVWRSITDVLTTELLVDESPDSMVLEIRYRSTNEVDTMTVVKAVVRSYLDFVGEVGDRAVVITPAGHARIVETIMPPDEGSGGWVGGAIGFVLSFLIVCIVSAFKDG